MNQPSPRTGSAGEDRPTDAQVWVAMGTEDVLAGQLYSHRRRGAESASFAYTESYLARKDAYALDPALPLLTGLQQSPTNQKIFGAWEMTALDLAAAARIVVPGHQLVSIAGRDVLIVDRFDRTATGERVGYMSAMTALEATDGDTRSYVEIAEVLEERSLNTTAELEQLWRRIALFILISNTDDHLRNHAFLHVRNEAWSLSPAFDINPNPDPGPKHLSTAISDDTRADLRDLVDVADLFRLTHTQARKVLGEVAASIRRWPHVAARNGLSKSAIANMAPAFTHQQSDIAQQLTT